MKALLDVLEPGTRERELANSLDPARLPAHIAVIMDGNGRWAKQRHLPRAAGHRAGVDAVRATVETCARLGIRTLTLYAFSIENWKRPESEVSMLMHLLRHYLAKEQAELQRNNIRFRAIGRLAALAAGVRRELQQVMEATAANTGLCLNLALNYGGRSEIIDAVNALIGEARREGRLEGLELDEAQIEARLYTAGQADPDLLIRTSGEMRISNFLLWQIAYAELYVTETYWPDFDRGALLEAIAAYQKRDRRYGGVRSEEQAAAESGSGLESVSARVQ
jgi:undecaprenyl diphosphate synthase